MKNPNFLLFSILTIFGHFLTPKSKKITNFPKNWHFSRFKRHKMTKNGQNQTKYKIRVLHFGLKSISNKFEEVWMKTVWLLFILAWKLLKFDPYGFSHVFEKTPLPRFFITFELLEIIQKGKKFWKEEIEHYKILETGRDLAFWP